MNPILVVKMAARGIARRAVQIFLFFGFTTLLLMVYIGRAQNELEARELVQVKKQEIMEQVRRERLLDLQKTIFINPNRPADHTYNINVTLSERTPLEREVNDSRPTMCRSYKYDLHKLPTISVIIPFYNEALSMLLRTVHSILKRTPEHLLKDIILVNDYSRNEDLHGPLERYVKLLPQKVRLLKTPRREGLIRARIIGARHARGDVLMFQVGKGSIHVNWLISQIAQCIRKISNKAPFCNRNGHTCAKNVHCGIWERCIVRFVRLLYLCSS